MSWTKWTEISESDIATTPDDSEVVRTGKTLIGYVLDLDGRNSDYKQGWVEAVDQMISELEGDAAE